MPVRATLLLLLLVCLPTIAPAQQVILGVLEEIPAAYAGEHSSYGVRVLFREAGSEWQAFPSNCPDQECLKTIPSQFPSEIRWTIAFDGRSLGQLTAETPLEYNLYSRVGLQRIISTPLIPSMGERALEFSGFLQISVHRPLVAVSQPYFNDPDSWKPSSLSTQLIAVLRQQFRQNFPKLCRVSKQDETQLEPLPYRDEDVHLVKAYASKAGWVVARLHLDNAVDCLDTEAAFQIDDPWFTVDPAKLSHYLDSGMWLVDAGDYGNDGASALLFSISRYNRGGYILFYDHFLRRAAFEFSYH